MAESPGSSLSSLSSEDFNDDLKAEDNFENSSDAPETGLDAPSMPPAKRQRTCGPSWDQRASLSVLDNDDHDTETDISTDTEGDVPGSPITATVTMGGDEEPSGHEQVTICRWDGCPVGEMGNMDNLVAHIHDDHIGVRQKKYSCEWEECSRKGMPHASGYALRAHMRSHTREKPFFCLLPECDRSFTRSDALAKHMRTVHETEALRPSDPVPKHHQTAQQQQQQPNKNQRLKLIFTTRPPQNAQRSASSDRPSPLRNGNGNTPTADDRPSPWDWPADCQFTKAESLMPPSQLYRLLRRQVHWAEQESTTLRAEVEVLEKQRLQEWQAKELVLANVLEAELAAAVSRGQYAVDDGEDGAEVVGRRRKRKLRLEEDLPVRRLPMAIADGGEVPWFRRDGAVATDEDLPIGDVADGDVANGDPAADGVGDGGKGVKPEDLDIVEEGPISVTSPAAATE
ncbi:MAG: hypothetical protein M1819_000178 [Sarea resinae]|nr:MAG: hypothetical protein M1819_000178 [Sarea resinae]